MDTEGVCNTNCVGNLDESTVAEIGGDEGFGDPSGSVCCATVNLSWVLSGEGSTSVSAPSSVCVDDDLTASKTGISVWATTGEASTWVEMVDGVLIKVLCGDDWGDDLFLELGLEVLKGDIWAVLGRDEDGVDTEWGELSVLVFILDGDLGFAVWADPWAGAILADLSELVAELGGEAVGKRHEVLAFVASIAEHVSLITSSDVFDVFVDVD